MNLDDGKYLAVEYDNERIVSLPHGQPLYLDPSREDAEAEPSLNFEDSPSEATLFRVKEYPFIRDQGFDLEIGSRVHHRVWGPDQPDHWISARVIATKFSAFGKEVKLKCGGYCSHYFHDIYRIDGVTDWIPALSPDITRYDPHYEYGQSLLEIEYLWNQSRVCNQWEKEETPSFECNVCDPTMMDDERYKKRVKSRKMRKSKKKTRGHYSDWNVADKRSLKRIERKSRKYGRIEINDVV